MFYFNLLFELLLLTISTIKIFKTIPNKQQLNCVTK